MIIRNQCNYFLAVIAIFAGMIGMVGCREAEEPVFSPETAPICPEDSMAYMELYKSLNLQETDPRSWVKVRSNVWRFVEFEYDELTRYRHICRIDIQRTGTDPTADSIPSSIGRLSHLRYLSLKYLKFNKNFTFPAEVFSCPLDTLIFVSGYWTKMDDPESVVGLMGQLPSEIRMVKSTLKYLRIECTALSELCEELTELTNLQECRLSDNLLSGRIPDYIGDMSGMVDLSFNRYTEYNWCQILVGKNIPWAQWNYIHNEMPPEMKDAYIPWEIMCRFSGQIVVLD